METLTPDFLQICLLISTDKKPNIRYMKNLFFFILLCMIGETVSAQSSQLTVIKTFHIKSAGGWDYLAISPISNNLYVSHGTQVNILNKTSGDSVGVFEGTIGVHGITFAPEFKKGFISNGKLNNLFVFDAVTNKILDTIAVGTKPDAMCYDAYSKRLIVGDGKSNDATIVDVATNKVLATVPLNGKPEASVSDDNGNVYVNIEDKNEIAVLDIKAMKVIKRYKLGTGEEPSGLAIDKAKGILFVGCGNKQMIVVDTKTGTIKASLPIGDHCDGVGFDASTGNAFASNGDGSLNVIHANSKGGYSVTDNIATKKGAKTIAVDEKTHLIYLPTADFSSETDPKGRPQMIPGTFQILVLGKK